MTSYIGMVPSDCSYVNVEDMTKLCFKRLEIKSEYLPFPTTVDEWEQRFCLELDSYDKARISEDLETGIENQISYLLHHYFEFKYFDYELYDDIDAEFDDESPVIFTSYRCLLKRSGLLLEVQPELPLFLGLSYHYMTSQKELNSNFSTLERIYKELMDEGRITNKFKLMTVYY